MPRSFVLTTVALAALLGAPGRSARAQVSGQITAQAGLGAQVGVNGQQNLTWAGNAYPGVPKTVAATDPTAARFQLTGSPATAEMSVTVNPPTELAGPGGAMLAIDGWSLCVGSTATQSGCSAYAWASLPMVRRLVAGQLYLWIGARVAPTPSQAAGTYVGVLEVVALFTGN
jgi:hypothetical protein